MQRRREHGKRRHIKTTAEQILGVMNTDSKKAPRKCAAYLRRLVRKAAQDSTRKSSNWASIFFCFSLHQMYYVRINARTCPFLVGTWNSYTLSQVCAGFKNIQQNQQRKTKKLERAFQCSTEQIQEKFISSWNKIAKAYDVTNNKCPRIFSIYCCPIDFFSVFKSESLQIVFYAIFDN